MTTLRRFVSGEQVQEEQAQEDQQYRAHVEEVYDRHRELLEKQDSLLQSGSFYRAVGSAIARMPCARTLTFDDSYFRRSGPNLQAQLMMPGVDMWEWLAICMLQPLNGHAAINGQLDTLDYQCVIPLIDFVRQAGAFVVSLTFTLDSLGRPLDLVPGPELRPVFSFGMQQLRAFTLKLGHRPIRRIDNGEDESVTLHGFLSACLDTSSLRTLSLNMCNGQDSPLRLGQIFSQNQKKMDAVYLAECALDGADLAAFVGRLPKAMSLIFLCHIRLLAGSWKASLDAFRAKQPRNASPMGVQGAECEGMTRKEYNRIFERSVGITSEADRFILSSGEEDRNPIQKFEDGEFDSDSDDE